jgi:hypothetical protein
MPLQGKGGLSVSAHEHSVMPNSIPAFANALHITPQAQRKAATSAALRNAYDAMHMNSQRHESSNQRGCMMIIVAVQQLHLHFGHQQHR